VHRYTRAGVLDTIVLVPDATQITSMGFGGPELDILFVTTAREHLDPAAEAAQPNAGGILAVRPETVGQATASFAL
jgi:sugar lactone lactonase YvrE